MTAPLPERTCNPVWRNVFLTTVNFEAPDPPPGDLRLEVWDVGSSYKHRFLGEVCAPFPDRPCRRQYQLKLEHNASKMDDATKIVNGYLSFQVKFGSGDLFTLDRELEDVSLVPAIESHSVTGQLVLTISKGKSIPRSDVLPTSDPYCLVYVAAGPKQVVSWRTATKLATRDPVWDETREFSINWPKSEVGEAAIVRVEVWDYDVLTDDDFLGEVTFPLPGAECDDALELELQPNRKKGAVFTQGKLSINVLFKEQFSQLEEPETGLTPYEKAFARYHGARPANDPLARAVASGLLFFHLGPRRLLAGLLPPAFRRASCGLLRGPRELREQRYWLLSCSLWSVLAAAALVLWLVRDRPTRWGSLAERPRACGAGLGLLLGAAPLDPAGVLAAFAWQHVGGASSRAARAGALPAAGDPAAPFCQAVVLASWLGVAVCLGRAQDHEAVALLCAAGALLLARALVRPLGASLLQWYALLRAQVSSGFDTVLWWYPSVLNVHGLLGQAS
ncbi:unnamed protein product [Prorocentrum cordatum]|uniref:C2 domain-containing protein n=1 Tax=Prorocentrum cordatum TaxID=2364126 RepID=A0ABN9UJW8_9DINO|nr:unnamed protein product [Polarella glacialis]